VVASALDLARIAMKRYLEHDENKYETLLCKIYHASILIKSSMIGYVQIKLNALKSM
jgi:hypothetical protein